MPPSSAARKAAYRKAFEDSARRAIRCQSPYQDSEKAPRIETVEIWAANAVGGAIEDDEGGGAIVATDVPAGEASGTEGQAAAATGLREGWSSRLAEAGGGKLEGIAPWTGGGSTDSGRETPCTNG